MTSELIEVVDAVSAGQHSLMSWTRPTTEHVSQVNAATEYLKTLGSETSRRAIRSRLNQIARWFNYPDAEHCDWQLMRYEHIIDFLDHLRNSVERTSPHQYKDNELKTSTVNSYLYAIKSVARIAWKLGQMSDHDLARIISTKPVRGYNVTKGRAMSMLETAALLNVCNGSNPIEIRDRAILGLMLGNGLRRAEVTHIEMPDIRLDKNEIIVKGKGNKERLIILIPEIATFLNAWISIRAALNNDGKYQNNVTDPESDFLFCRFNKTKTSLVKNKPLSPKFVWVMVNGYIEKAAQTMPSLKGISCHDFRRTFATRLFKNGVDIVVIRNLMGHSSIATTAKYDKRDDDAMRQAMQSIQI